MHILVGEPDRTLLSALRVPQMSVTVFYSWQTDAPSGLNRNFIEGAIERAIKRIKADAEVVNSLRGDEMALDKDTKGRSGSPAIADTILEKIDECAVFVPDLTFVAQTDKNRPTPNPNVLIEYGYALKSRGQARIVGVMNMAFGAPSAETLPFNMRHLRWPITYELAEGAEKAEVRKQLVDQLAGAIRAVLETGPVAEAEETEREGVTRWFNDSMERWHELRSKLPEGHGGRMEHGHYAVGYQLIGNFQPLRGGGSS